ncbi:MAG: HAMP domain-containing histidine kinase [Breznakibacter sp.]|nr:HAMP domain-containing histidine kinase [Breznakibacter sp.]
MKSSGITHKNNRLIKNTLLLVAIGIGITSIIYTKTLVDTLKSEELKKVQLWADATKELSSAESPTLNLTLAVISNNTTVPVILVDKHDTILYHRNIKLPEKNQSAFLAKILKEMKDHSDSIVIELGNNDHQILYYKESSIITKLTYFTIIQLCVMIAFMGAAYIAFNRARNAEQNKVWVGLSKETAHQLGTPTSSLLGWVGLLKLKNIEPEIVTEIEKDVAHLERVTDRFSKIGAVPELKEHDVTKIINSVIAYLKGRTSSQIEFELKSKKSDLLTVANVNPTLLEWVLENISKNGIDAMEGSGKLTYHISKAGNYLNIDISDNGKGIMKKNFKAIFTPGFTTKKRGWGLGLSLSKRIIEEYHKGKLFVKESEIGKGTTFRISLICKS